MYQVLASPFRYSELGRRQAEWENALAAPPQNAMTYTPPELSYGNALAGTGTVAPTPRNLGEGNPNWLTYSNSGATRNQPLSPELIAAMAFLDDMGVRMDVFSGGQPAEGPNRVGSTRHNHGNAADVFFYQGGDRLDWGDPNDIPILEEIVRRARANGLTGFGAGDGYMQPGSMHIGFGAPAVWGAGGKGANAPQWLRDAYYG